MNHTCTAHTNPGLITSNPVAAWVAREPQTANIASTWCNILNWKFYQFARGLDVQEFAPQSRQQVLTGAVNLSTHARYGRQIQSARVRPARARSAGSASAGALGGQGRCRYGRQVRSTGTVGRYGRQVRSAGTAGRYRRQVPSAGTVRFGTGTDGRCGPC